MSTTPSLAFDRDIFDLQKHGGIRLYYTQLSHSLATNCASRINISFPELSLDVLPPAFQSQRNVMLMGSRLCQLLASFVSAMLPAPIWRARKIYHATYYRNLLLRWSLNPTVVTIHDMIHETYPQYFDPYYKPSLLAYVRAKRSCIFAADAIVAVSYSTKQDLLRIYPQIPSSRVHVIHHGSDHIPAVSSRDVFDYPLFGEVSFSRFLLFVGSRAHYKGFDILLSGFSKFSPLYPDVGLVCVGSLFAKEEQDLISQLSLSGKVISASATPSQLVSLYAQAVALVYPSWYEGFGLPILEAMRARCPVLCSDIPSSREIADRHALFFKPGDSLDLLSKLMILVDLHPVSRERNLRDAQEHASSFTWNDTASNTCDLYLSLL